MAEKCKIFMNWSKNFLVVKSRNHRSERKNMAYKILKYLLLSLNSSWALVFCMDTVCVQFQKLLASIRIGQFALMHLELLKILNDIWSLVRSG